MGSQWALFMPTDEHDSLRTLVNIHIVHKGVMAIPLGTYSIQLLT